MTKKTRTEFSRYLKLRHFKVVEMLNATRSMQAAAARLHVTPAAISKSCLEAEALLGAPLFERTAKGLIPTHLCGRIIATGQRIKAELSALDEDILQARDVLEGVVRIGFQAPALQDRLAHIVVAIKKKHPLLTIALEYGMRANLLTALETNRYDFVLIDLIDAKSNPRFEVVQLDEDQICVLTEHLHLPMRTVVDNWADYADRMWLIQTPGMAMRTRFEAFLALRGLKLPGNVIECNSPVGAEEITRINPDIVVLNRSCLVPADARKFIESADVALQEMSSESGLVWLRDARLSFRAQTVFDILFLEMSRGFAERV